MMETEKTKPRIINVPFCLSNTGSYIPDANIIFLDENLLKFPKFREKILRHELGHVKYAFNPWKHFIWDLFDGLPLLYSLECKEYMEYDKPTYKELFSKLIFEIKSLFCMVTYLILHILIDLILVFIIFSNKTKDYFKKLKKGGF